MIHMTTKTRDRKKLPNGASWIIGAIFGIIIWILCTFVLVDTGATIGIILGFSSVLAIVVSIEDLHQKPLTPNQQKKLEWLVIGGIVTLIIGILLYTIFNVTR